MLSKRIEIKYYLALILALSTVMGLLVGILFSDSEPRQIHLDTLGRGKYEYVYTASGSVGCDDYLYGTGKMSFAVEDSLSEGIYSDVLMLLRNSEYTELTPFGSEFALEDRECAVSENLAALHSLTPGDMIYSRHRVTGEIVGYTVTKLLPPSYGVTEADVMGGKGVIIVGCDDDFISLVRSEYIGFTNDSPSAITKAAGVALTGFESRSDIALEILAPLLISVAVLVLAVSAVSCIAIMLHSRYQRTYYTRLALFGMPAAELKRLEFLDYFLPVVISNVIAALIACLILSLRHGIFAWRTPLVCFGVGIISSFVCSFILSRKIKRY